MTGLQARVRSAVTAGVAAIVLTGCAAMVSVDQARPGVVPVGAEGQAPFPECQADAYAFVGRTSLGAIGLGEMVGGQEANRVGSVWVTAGPPEPGAFPGGPGAPPPAQRVVCVEWPDGSGMSTTIDDGWVPPGAGEVVSTEVATELAIGPIVAVTVVLLSIGISVIAFRREPDPGRAA